jgi:hypothetical protein
VRRDVKDMIGLSMEKIYESTSAKYQPFTNKSFTEFTIAVHELITKEINVCAVFYLCTKEH